ncbi:MAG: NAD-dependent epimerase/dehydratase family protein [Coriobacteriia bacterium]
MKVLLVGGNGFIGSHVQDLLLARGHSVRVLDSLPERYRLPLPGVDYRAGSSADPSVMAEAVAGVDSVVYLASTTVPSTSNSSIPWDIESNLIPLVASLDIMNEAGVQHIVFFSSGGTVYGPAGESAVRESTPLEPICSYGVVKVASEKYLGMYRNLNDLRSLVLRPSNPYGPRQGHDGVQGFIGTSLAKMLRNEPIEIWGDGSVVRDYLYVQDLASAVVLGVETRAAGVVNIGSGVGRSLLEVVARLEDVTGAIARVEFLPGRSFDVPHMVLAVELATELLGWGPSTSLEDGIAAHWRWLQGVRVQG